MTRSIFLRLLLLPCLALTLSSCGLLGALIKTALPFAGIKLAFACLPEGTQVDTPTGPRAVEDLSPGDAVIGFDGSSVRILQKHAYLEQVDTPFLRVHFSGGAVVDLCTRHRIAGLPAGSLRVGQVVADQVVEQIEVYEGVSRSFDLLTEDAGYRIGGIPVNSMIEEMHAAAAGLPPLGEYQAR